MRAEVVFCSILLVLEAILVFNLPGSPVLAPVMGGMIALFLGILAKNRDLARKLRFALAFVLFLIPAAANKGNSSQIVLAIITASHFITWTEGFVTRRRFAVKKGESMPPDGRPAVYSLAFIVAIALSYLFLSEGEIALSGVTRTLLAFVAALCGFCLWDVGYITRLQAASRLRRPKGDQRILTMRSILLAAVIASLFMIFGRAVPAAADSVHEIAAKLRDRTGRFGGDPLKGDRDRKPNANWNKPVDSWVNPHQLPSEGNFGEDPSLILAMEVPDPAHRDRLLDSRAYLRGYALIEFANDQWTKPTSASGQTILDETDGASDGRVVLNHSLSEELTPIVHTINMLQPFYDVLPALQEVNSYRLPMISRKPGDWFTYVGAPPANYVAESTPRLFTDLENAAQLQTANAGTEALKFPNNPLTQQMRRLVENAQELPLEEKIHYVLSLLRERCEYSQSIRNPGKFDALQNFLYGEKEGVCLHFATASTLLLRMLNVPTRMAFGFSGGEYYADKDVFAFRAKDAHTWSEVFLADIGWTVVDATPEQEGAARSPRTTNAPADYLARTEPPDPAKGLEDELEEPQKAANLTPNWFRKLRDLPWGWITIVLLAIVFSIAFIISSRQKKKEAAPESETMQILRKEKLPHYLSDFYRLCEKRLGAKKLSHSTLQEFLSELRADSRIRSEFDDLLAYFYETSYAGVQADRQKETRFRQQIRAFSSQLDQSS